MLKQGFYVHVQRQAVPQVAKDLLVLFLHRGNISPAKGRVQIPHTVHMGSNVVHSLPDAVVAGIVVQKPVEVVIQRDEEVICCILIQIKVFVLPVQQFLKFVQLFPCQLSGQPAQQRRFQNAAHGKAFVQVWNADLGHNAAALNIHKPLAFQHHQRFVYRCAAHGQLFAQFGLAQLTARLQLQGHNIFAQHTVGVSPVIFVHSAHVQQQRQCAGLFFSHSSSLFCLP